MLLHERLQHFYESKDRLSDSWDIRDFLHREIEAALVTQCVHRDDHISRKRIRNEATRLIDVLEAVFHITFADANGGDVVS